MKKISLICLIFVFFCSCATLNKNAVKNNKNITQLEEDYNAGLLALSLNDFERAKDLLSKCIKNNYKPDFSSLYLGITYYKLKRYDLAEKFLKQALKLNPDLTEAHNSLGAVYASQKKYKLALKEFNEVLLDTGYLFPENALYNIALIYYNEGDYLKSLDYCNKTLVIVPKSPMVYYLIALNYYKLGKKGVAKRYLEDIIKNFNKSNWAILAKKFMKEKNF